MVEEQKVSRGWKNRVILDLTLMEKLLCTNFPWNLINLKNNNLLELCSFKEAQPETKWNPTISSCFSRLINNNPVFIPRTLSIQLHLKNIRWYMTHGNHTQKEMTPGIKTPLTYFVLSSFRKCLFACLLVRDRVSLYNQGLSIIFYIKKANLWAWGLRVRGEEEKGRVTEKNVKLNKDNKKEEKFNLQLNNPTASASQVLSS